MGYHTYCMSGLAHLAETLPLILGGGTFVQSTCSWRGRGRAVFLSEGRGDGGGGGGGGGGEVSRHCN